MHPGSEPMNGDSVVVAAHDDAVERDGEMLVLVGTELALLSSVAAALVREAAEPKSIDQLGAVLVAEYGVPAGDTPTTAVLRIAEELLGRGIIELH